MITFAHTDRLSKLGSICHLAPTIKYLEYVCIQTFLSNISIKYSEYVCIQTSFLINSRRDHDGDYDRDGDYDCDGYFDYDGDYNQAGDFDGNYNCDDD